MALRKNAKRNLFTAKLVTENRMPCAFCQRDVDDELIYGKLYAIGDIQCHYFCVLLSSCLVQKGKDTDGLFGFMYNDILAEIERSKKHKCSYCGRGGATLGCAVSQCRKQFHLPCGRERNAVSMFYGNYKSFCQKHFQKQKISDEIMEKVKMRRKEANKTKDMDDLEFSMSENEEGAAGICVICYERVRSQPAPDTFWPPCCARDAWFHRHCLQRMALSAGMHYLKCPLCNDKESFYEAVINQGYYVPDRDAAWELEQNAFSEIYERVLECTADTCLCPMGRNHDTEGAWDVIPCLLCGSAGWHRACARSHAAPPAPELPAAAGGDSTLVAVCSACRPAAPADLHPLTAAIQALRRREAELVMPSRMSLRRTKRLARGARPPAPRPHRRPRAHHSAEQHPPAPLEPRHEPPRAAPASPTQLVERGLRERMDRLGGGLRLQRVLGEVQERLRRPKPLSEKLKAINTILDSVLDGATQNDAPEPCCSPRQCAHGLRAEQQQAQQAAPPAQSDDSSRPSPPPPESTADTNSDDSLPVFNSPTKHTTVDMQRHSSLEISANDKSVHIDVLQLEDNDDGQFLRAVSVTSPVSSNKCALKFSPTDKEMLQENNIGIDLESFKNHYLHEVVRECATEVPRVNRDRKRKRPRDVRRSAKKRRLDEFKHKPNERRVKKKKLKTHVSITNDNIQVKIKWRTERLNLKITDAKKRMRNKLKMKDAKKMNKLKQYVLQYTNDPVKDVIVKPEKEVSPLKRKYVKQEKSPDKLVQTSIQRFFTVKSPKD